MSTTLAFDTLQYAKRLKQAGFTEEQAEVQAEALKDLIDDKQAEALKDLIDDKLATKQDIINAEERLINRINEASYKVTMRLGSMIISGVVTLGAFLALIKFLA